MNKTNIVTVETLIIEPNPYQNRFVYAEENMDELKQSIQQLGIITPLVLRRVGERYQLVSGSRRLKAAKELGLPTVPALVKDLLGKEAVEITITENLQREELSAIEESCGFQELLVDFNYTHEQLAAKLGKSRSYISNSLRLLKLPMIVLGYVLRKTLTPWHARALLPLSDVAAVEASAYLVAEMGWSVRETKDYVQRYLAGERFFAVVRDPLGDVAFTPYNRAFLSYLTRKLLQGYAQRKEHLHPQPLWFAMIGELSASNSCIVKPHVCYRKADVELVDGRDILVQNEDEAIRIVCVGQGDAIVVGAFDPPHAPPTGCGEH